MRNIKTSHRANKVGSNAVYILTIRYSGSLQLDAVFCAELSMEKVAQHFFALGAIFNADVYLVGRCSGRKEEQ